MERVASLREFLREETRDLHDALDKSLSPLAGGPDYSRFLTLQLSARRPVEAWFAGHSNVLQPPAQSPLIESDLAVLGCTTPVAPSRFSPASPEEAIGIAWVIAGSSLGNRVMLKRRLAYDGGLATSFLSDGLMFEFWATLRPRLERGAASNESEAAVIGARRTFLHFLDVARQDIGRLAA